MVFSWISIKFAIFAMDWGNSFQYIREKKKRYAYLVDENVGNFQRVQGEHSGSHAIGVGCYIHICTQGIFPTTFI